MDTTDWLRYLILPGMLAIFSALVSVGWYMFKKQDARLDQQDNRIVDVEKDIIELKTEVQSDIKYMSRDLKEIKEMLTKSFNGK